MNIVVIMPLAEQRGGGELMLAHLLMDGRLPGVQWCVIFLEEGPMAVQAHSLGVETHVVAIGRVRYLHRTCAAFARIAAIIRRFKADVVLGWMGKGHLYGSVAARIAGVPSAWYQLGTANPSSQMDRLVARLPAIGILACSQLVADAQATLKPLRPLRVVYPGAELQRFDPSALPCPEAARQSLGLPPIGPLIGIVGRLQRWKGMHTLIEAMPDILERYPDAHAVIVGGVHALEPEYEAYLKQRIAALHLEEHVLMAGLQHNVPQWMQAMDVIVHASDHEPFGIVIIEAMALGKPIVAGDAGGPREIVTEEVNGLLAPYENAAVLSQCIMRYLDDPAFAARLGAAAHLRAAEFSTQRYAQNVIAAVQDLLKGVRA